ncbi:MAG: GatB/YqeY domain-containing protein [Bacilli bacterium]|nr:GatB/YqeY domain-containing protein [Bacilli bacterium]MBO6194876.1 GatB/YqeY domain-containing protein [Bacilli bacterium]
MKEKLQKELIEAMKAHDKKKIDVIKLVKATIQNEEISTKKELSDEEVLSIINKQVKMRKDAISDFEKAGRQDLIDQYNSEIELLNEYLPKELTEEEAMQIIDEAFNLVNPTGPSDMGKIMKEVSPKLKNRFDMGKASKIIKDKLS